MEILVFECYLKNKKTYTTVSCVKMKTNKIYSCAPTKKRFKVIIKQNYTVRTFFRQCRIDTLFDFQPNVCVNETSFVFISFKFFIQFHAIEICFSFLYTFREQKRLRPNFCIQKWTNLYFCFSVSTQWRKNMQKKFDFWRKENQERNVLKSDFLVKNLIFSPSEIVIPCVECWEFTESSLQQWTECSLSMFQCRLIW